MTNSQEAAEDDGKPDPKNIKECIDCGAKILGSARVCKHCNSYQYKRRYLNLSHAPLALAVALVSVLAFAVPILIEAFHEPRSNVVLSSPIVTDKEISFVVTNTGDLPAVVDPNIGVSFFISAKNLESMKTGKNSKAMISGFGCSPSALMPPNIG